MSNKTKTPKVSNPEIITYDMYRNRIQPGDYISYPGRKGSDTYMRTAKVLGLRRRHFVGEEPEVVLSVAMAKAPRHFERAAGNWNTKIIKTTVSIPYRTTVLPKSYVQNDRRYACLLDV